MTVAELIQELMRMPQGAEVAAASGEYPYLIALDAVKYEERAWSTRGWSTDKAGEPSDAAVVIS